MLSSSDTSDGCSRSSNCTGMSLSTTVDCACLNITSAAKKIAGVINF